MTKKWKFRIGVLLISLSVLIFLSVFIVPFIGINLKEKISFFTVLVITGEVMYWTGTLLIGKEVWRKYKEWLKSGKWLEK